MRVVHICNIYVNQFFFTRTDVCFTWCDGVIICRPRREHCSNNSTHVMNIIHLMTSYWQIRANCGIGFTKRCARKPITCRMGGFNFFERGFFVDNISQNNMCHCRARNFSRSHLMGNRF